MKLGLILKLTLIIMGLLIVTNFVEGALVGYGLINPIVAGIALPVIPALILVLLILFLRERKLDKDI